MAIVNDVVYFEEDLGRGYRVSYKEYHGKMLLHLRMYEYSLPTKKGVCLSPKDAKVLMNLSPRVLAALEAKEELELFINDDIKLRVTDYGTADIRLFWVPPGDIERVPTKCGVNLKKGEFEQLSNIMNISRHFFMY